MTIIQEDDDNIMETTLYIGVDVLNKISVAAQKFGISRSEMIIIILKKMMDDIGDPSVFGNLVRYQGRRRPEDWHTFHITLRPDDYEYFIDLRKLLKSSVSMILTIAVKRYLKKCNIIKKADNYRKNYVLIKSFIDKITCWNLIWGYPYNDEKLFNPTTSTG